MALLIRAFTRYMSRNQWIRSTWAWCHMVLSSCMNEVEENPNGVEGQAKCARRRVWDSTESRHFLNGAPAKRFIVSVTKIMLSWWYWATHSKKEFSYRWGNCQPVLHGSNCDVLAVRIHDSD
jgi:hypothetical protein